MAHTKRETILQKHVGEVSGKGTLVYIPAVADSFLPFTPLFSSCGQTQANSTFQLIAEHTKTTMCMGALVAFKGRNERRGRHITCFIFRLTFRYLREVKHRAKSSKGNCNQAILVESFAACRKSQGGGGLRLSGAASPSL